MKTTLFLIVFLLLVMLPSGVLSQQGSTLSLEIMAIDNYTGTPIDSVLLTLWSDNQLIDQAYSNASGVAVLKDKATGIQITEDTPHSFTVGQNYPNPFETETFVDLTIFEPQKIGISLTNIKGQRLLQQTFELEDGTFGLQISTGGLPAGIYILQLTGKEQHSIRLQKTGTDKQSARPSVQLSYHRPTITAGSSLKTKSRAPYSVRAEKASYTPIEVMADPENNPSMELEMQRNNKVVLQVEDAQQKSLVYSLIVEGEDCEHTITSPDTLMIKSGIYRVFGETDTCNVDFVTELASRDTTLIIVPEKCCISFYDPETMISSPELIAIALEAGEINYETSLLYRAWALYGDPRLPEEYFGNVISLDDGTSLFSEILVNQDTISAGTMEQLRPFMLRPNDPESYFSKAFRSLKGIGTKSAVEVWDSRLTAGGRARVWAPADNSKLFEYAIRVNWAWNNLFEVLLATPEPDEPENPSDSINPDNAIDLYFLPLGTLDPRQDSCIIDSVLSPCTFQNAAGWACPDKPFFDNRSSSGYIIIDQDISGNFLFGTVVHELFHVGQYNYDFGETHWLKESTAVWAEFNVLNKLRNDVRYLRNRLKTMYKNLDRPLDRNAPSYHAYTTYLYSLFIQMENNEQAISQAWKATENQPTLGISAFDERFPLRDHFKEFALRNWNKAPVPRLYREIDPGFDPDLRPPIHETLQIPKGSEETIEEKLTPLSILYNRILVDLEDEDNLLLKLDLSQFTENPDAGIDAIVHIDGKEPELQRWSERDEVSFCLDDENEAVTEIILIISNASLDSELDCNIEIERINPCKFIFDYDVTVTWEEEDFTTVYTYSATVDVEREESGDLIHYTGIDTMETVALQFIPGEASGSIRAGRDHGIVEITFINDLDDSISCEELFTTMEMEYGPTEIITLIYPDSPPFELYEAGCGWSQIMLTHEYDGGDSPFLITNWECGPPDSELKAFKEYTKSYNMEGNKATSEVRVELRSE